MQTRLENKPQNRDKYGLAVSKGQLNDLWGRQSITRSGRQQKREQCQQQGARFAHGGCFAGAIAATFQNRKRAFNFQEAGGYVAGELVVTKDAHPANIRACRIVDPLALLFFSFSSFLTCLSVMIRTLASGAIRQTTGARVTLGQGCLVAEPLTKSCVNAQPHPAADKTLA